MALTAFAQQLAVTKANIGQSIAATMAATARQAFADAQAQNRIALGAAPPFQQFVDGREGAALESVKPGGTIAYAFAIGEAALNKAVTEAIGLFQERAPVGAPPKDRHPGLFRDSLRVLRNGEQIDPEAELVFEADDEVSLADLQPYSRKIEIRGALIAHVPRGLMEAITQTIRRRYGGVLNIRFSYELYPGFAVGAARAGRARKTLRDQQRAIRYPTIRLSVKS